MRIQALDSIRGFLLLQMTLEHFGKPLSKYLFQCFGFFSAAEGFFFLSGFVCTLAAFSKHEKDPGQGWMRKRAFRIWVYHYGSFITIVLLAHFLLPRVQWLVKGMLNHPLEATPLSALLVYTPMWQDVLPLYVILLLAGSFIAPLFVKAKSKKQIALLWLPSLALWIIAQFNVRGLINNELPRWIDHGTFDPLGWQFVYFTGAAVAAWWKHATKEQTRDSNSIAIVNKIAPFMLLPCIFCFLWSHQFLPIELPGDFFTAREHLGLFRFANFFMFMLLVSSVVRRFPTALDFKFTNTIGKCSLDVYTAHTVLLFLWFATPKDFQYSAPWNVVIPLCACALLWAMSKILLRIRKRK